MKIATGPGLYIHVPFCTARKCDYCAFYSIPFDEHMLNAYLNRLADDLKETIDEHAAQTIKTIFVGGGNPTCLGAHGLESLIKIITEHGPKNAVEFSFETNPETFTPEVADVLGQVPNVRISMGVQRLQDSDLATIGRRSVMATLHGGLSLACTRFKNVSADFILGVPNAESIAKDLDQFLCDYPLQHISTYFLSADEGTPFRYMVEQNELPDPADIGSEELFQVRDLLLRHGYSHYEISNFAQNNFKCKHNLNYWKSGDYKGVGPAAVSTWQGVRHYNVPDVNRWLAGEKPVLEQLDQNDRRNEFVMLRLRLLDSGLNISLLEGKFGSQPDSFYSELDWHLLEGNLVKSGNTVQLTDAGIIVADRVMSSLFI